jgi:hypothetical protein
MKVIYTQKSIPHPKLQRMQELQSQPILFFCNVQYSIREHMERDSNVRHENDPHSEEHAAPNTSTEVGITIPTNTDIRNADLPIRDHGDPDSNVTDESDRDRRKHHSPKISTNAGRIT